MADTLAPGQILDAGAAVITAGDYGAWTLSPAKKTKIHATKRPLHRPSARALSR